MAVAPHNDGPLGGRPEQPPTCQWTADDPLEQIRPCKGEYNAGGGWKGKEEAK